MKSRLELRYISMFSMHERLHTEQGAGQKNKGISTETIRNLKRTGQQGGKKELSSLRDEKKHFFFPQTVVRNNELTIQNYKTHEEKNPTMSQSQHICKQVKYKYINGLNTKTVTLTILLKTQQTKSSQIYKLNGGKIHINCSKTQNVCF